MSSTIDFVSPYGAIAQRHKDGLDAIIISIGAGGPGTVTVDDLIDAVYAYLVSVYTSIGIGPQNEESIRSLIANAINGYIQNGSASPYLRQLQSVPANTLVNMFDRMSDALAASPVLKGNTSRAQLVIALGQADAEYWGNQIATSGAWSPYMSTNPAIDLSNIPFWADAAMFGANFDFYQVNATDSSATASVLISALAGSLVVAAGKVVFGWVPKNSGMSDVGIIEVSEECSCNGGGSAMRISENMSQIGRPNNSGRSVPTNWHTPATGRSGQDTRHFGEQSMRALCTTFNSLYVDGDIVNFGPAC